MRDHHLTHHTTRDSPPREQRESIIKHTNSITSANPPIRESKTETGKHTATEQIKIKPSENEPIKTPVIRETSKIPPITEPPGNTPIKEQTMRDTSTNHSNRNLYMKNQLIRDQLFMRDPSKPRTRPRVKHTERLKEFVNVINEEAEGIQDKIKINTQQRKPQTATSAQAASLNTQPTSSRAGGQITKNRLSEDELIHYQLSQDQDSQEPDEPPCEQLTENQLIEILDQAPAHRKTVANK